MRRWSLAALIFATIAVPAHAFAYELHAVDLTATLSSTSGKGYSGYEYAPCTADFPLGRGKSVRLVGCPAWFESCSPPNWVPEYIDGQGQRIGIPYTPRQVTQLANNVLNGADYRAQQWVAMTVFSDGFYTGATGTDPSIFGGTGAGSFTIRNLKTVATASGSNAGWSGGSATPIQAVGETVTAPWSTFSAPVGNTGSYSMRIFMTGYGGRKIVGNSYQYWWKVTGAVVTRGSSLSAATWSSEATSSATPFSGMAVGFDSHLWSWWADHPTAWGTTSVAIFRDQAWDAGDARAGYAFTSKDPLLFELVSASEVSTSEALAALDPDFVETTATAGVADPDKPGGLDLLQWKAKFDEVMNGLTSGVRNLLWPLDVLGGW